MSTHKYTQWPNRCYGKLFISSIIYLFIPSIPFEQTYLSHSLRFSLEAGCSVLRRLDYWLENRKIAVLCEQVQQIFLFSTASRRVAHSFTHPLATSSYSSAGKAVAAPSLPLTPVECPDVLELFVYPPRHFFLSSSLIRDTGNFTFIFIPFYFLFLLPFPSSMPR